MFRTRRSGLVRRLWRSRLIPDREAEEEEKEKEEEEVVVVVVEEKKEVEEKEEEEEEEDEGDGSSSKSSEGGPDEASHSNPEKIPKTEYPLEERQRDEKLERLPARGLEEGETGVFLEAPGASIGLQEWQGALWSEGSDGRTVTCCLFKDPPPRPPGPGRGREALRVEENEKKCKVVTEQELKRCIYGFLKKLKEKSLDVLVEAVESRGGVMGDCVIVSPSEMRLGAHVESPHYLLCRLFRWPDLQVCTQLKALCHCKSFGATEGQVVCCNPYHYSRLCGPDSPPPPYSRLSPTPGQEPLDSFIEPSHPAMICTEIEATPSPISSSKFPSDASMSPSSFAHKHWCNVAYWEHRTRVGRLYPVYEPCLSIFYDLPQGTGLCLGLLPLPARSSSVQRTRAKIGHGILLSREPDGVWAYNRSQHPVFVNSPTLEPTSCSRGLTVRRVMPGYSLKVFDYDRSCQSRRPRTDSGHPEGPYDPNSLRISFAKGWGPCYSRQFITSCPCWLEILLNNHR